MINRAIPLKIPPNTLYLKEMRQLQPVLLFMIALEALFFVTLFLVTTFNSSSSTAERIAIPTFVYMNTFCAFTALLGSLFYSFEKNDGTGIFLLRMPLSRCRIFTTKILAAITTFVLFVFGSLLLFILVQSLWEPLQAILSPAFHGDGISLDKQSDFMRWESYAISMLVAYLACAWLSLHMKNPVLSLIIGIGIACLWPGTGAFRLLLVHRIIEDGQGLAGRAFAAQLAISLVLFLAAGGAFWRDFSRLEEKASPFDSGTGQTLSPRLLRSSKLIGLYGAEARQKRLTVWVLLLVNMLITTAVASFPNLAPFLGFWAFLSGTVMGISLLTQPERNSIGFFLYHLPISRSKIFWRRVLIGMIFGGILSSATICLGILMFMILFKISPLGETWSHLAVLFRAAHEIYLWDILRAGLISFCIYALAFFTGCVFSLLQSSDISGFLDCLLALSVPVGATFLMWSTRFYSPFLIPIAYPGIPFVLFLGWLAWWVTCCSRIAEPDARKDLWLLSLIAAVWGFAILLSLIDPLDLLYLIGIDLYGIL